MDDSSTDTAPGSASSSDADASSGPVARALRSFAAAHGGSATAVVEHVGRGSARVVVVGADGAWGDQVVTGPDGTALAAAACARAGVPVAPGWTRELSDAMRTGPADWRAMAAGRPVPA